MQDQEEFNNLIQEANDTYIRNFPAETGFRKTILASWNCNISDCDFCYGNIQKHKMVESNMAKRPLQSILAETYLCKKLGWGIDCLSASSETYGISGLVEVCKRVAEIYGEKIWLNANILGRGHLEELRPYVKGIIAEIKTMNRDLHKTINPSRPISQYLQMFNEAKGFEKSIIIILGIGETFYDMKELFNLIESNSINRVNFYALSPVKGTRYSKGPSSEYYARWIASTRVRFPKLEIAAGTWVDRMGEVSLLLKAGANYITRFPAIKLFNSEFAKVIEEEARNANRKFRGTLTQISYIKDVKDMLDEFKPKVLEYIKSMEEPKVNLDMD